MSEIDSSDGELLTSGQIARLADTNPSTVSNWIKRYPHEQEDGFPKPVATGSRGGLWDKDDVIVWLKARGKELKESALSGAQKAYTAAEQVRAQMPAKEIHLAMLRLAALADLSGNDPDLTRALQHAPRPNELVSEQWDQLQGLQGRVSVEALYSIYAKLNEQREGQKRAAIEEVLAILPRTAEVSDVPQDLIDHVMAILPTGTKTLLDASCGTGSMLLAAIRSQTVLQKVYGQDAARDAAGIAELRLLVDQSRSGRRQPTFEVQVGSALEGGRLHGEPVEAALCVAGSGPKDYTWLWVRYLLDRLQSGGVAVLAAPERSAWEASSSGPRSEALFERSIRAVVSLDEFTVVWVLQHRPDAKNPDVLMVDAASMEGPQELHRVMNSWLSVGRAKEVDGQVKAMPWEELVSRDPNLHPIHWLKPVDIGELQAEALLALEEVREAQQELLGLASVPPLALRGKRPQRTMILAAVKRQGWITSVRHARGEESALHVGDIVITGARDPSEFNASVCRTDGERRPFGAIVIRLNEDNEFASKNLTPAVLAALIRPVMSVSGTTTTGGLSGFEIPDLTTLTWPVIALEPTAEALSMAESRAQELVERVRTARKALAEALVGSEDVEAE